MPSGKTYPLLRALHAYHEAGHAVVWHVVGGLVEEVSIASSQAGYMGHCRFDFLIPQRMSINRLMSDSVGAGLTPERSLRTQPGCSLWHIIVPLMEGRTTI